MADRLLLLGASGTVGSAVARAFQQAGYELVCLVRTVHHRNVGVIQARGAEIIEGDMNVEAALQSALKGCRYLVHSAAPYPASGLHFRLPGMLKRWLPQLRRKFELAAEAGVEKVVFTSSLSTIGLAEPGELADETMAYDPKRQGGGNYYPVKAALEETALTAARATGLDTVIVNPTGLIGEGSRHPELAAALVFHDGLTPLTVDARLNFVDCRDAGRGHVQALERGRPGERYLLGGVNTTLLELASQICGFAGRQPPLVVPRFLAKIGAWFQEWVGLFTGGPGALSLTSYYHLAYGQHYSSAKAQRELGYVASSDLRDAIYRELRWHSVLGAEDGGESTAIAAGQAPRVDEEE